MNRITLILSDFTVEAFRTNLNLRTLLLEGFMFRGCAREASMAESDNSAIDAHLKAIRIIVAKVYQPLLRSRLWFSKITGTVQLILGSLLMEWPIGLSR